MKNSNKNEKMMISEKIEKSLQDWKLPPSSSSDFFVQNDSACCIPDRKVKTVEKEISLPPGYSSVPLFSKRRKRAHSICNSTLYVGIIQVALKPTKLGLNTCAIICLRRQGYSDFNDSVLAMVESSLCDGPIHFPYFPTYDVSLPASMRSDFTIDVKVEGYENVTLMYKFHYEVMKGVISYSSRRLNDEKGETTFFLTSIAQSNRVVSKKFYWNRIGVSKGLMVDDDSSPGAVGKANIDWRETVEAHVLKADVPGFKKEDVHVVVEAGGILLISGERSNDEEEDENYEWHCLERSNGKFLRHLKLPENANFDKMEVAMENGVLTVTVPKEEVGNSTQGGKVISVSA